MLTFQAMNPIKRHRRAGLIAAAFFILATSYSIVTPLFESPDELWHYPFVWHLARGGGLPVQDPARPQLWQQEGSQPPLYYALAALVTAPIPADDLPALLYRNPHADLGIVRADGNANIVVHTHREGWPWRGAVLAIHVARLFSVLLATGSVVTVYLLSRVLWPARPAFAALAMAFVAFNPMFLFISGSVNNDNLIILLASLTLWRLVALLTTPAAPSLWSALGLGLLTGLAALTKVSGLGLVGLTGLVFVGLAFKHRAWQPLGLAAVVGLGAALTAGWWYWRNYQLYGDWSGTAMMVTMMGGRPVALTWGQLLSELPGLARSFWGLFGYFSVPLPAPLYGLFYLIFLAGGLGWLLILTQRRWLAVPPGLWHAWPVLLGWLVIMVAGLLQWTLRTPATQGRLLFPALAALAPLWAAGWLALAPRRWLALPVILMAAVSIWTPWGVIGPAYARPVALSGLPATVQPLEATFGGVARLRGYEVGSGSLRPGESLPVTLYWQAAQPITNDYSVFIHLVDEAGLTVAQRDVWPGPGVFPTSQWPVEMLFADTYVLPLPATTYAPVEAQVVVGLYDYTNGQRLPLTSSGGDSLRFGQVQIEPRPGAYPNPQQLRFADGIELVGYDLDRRQAEPGQTITLTLYWQAEQTPSQDYKVFVHLVGENGDRVAQHDGQPGNGQSPTGSWSPGHVIIDQHPLTIAADASPGGYTLFVGLYDSKTGQRLSLLQDGPHWLQSDSLKLSGVRVGYP